MNRTLLVIEDDPKNMKLMRCILSLRQFKVLEAVDAETGLEMAYRLCPGLIFMDIKLPGMDGLQATRILRRNPKFKETPIIAVTSYAMQADRERAAAAGCDEYVPKPVDMRALLKIVDRLMNPGGTKDSQSTQRSIRPANVTGPLSLAVQS
jgi:CheY-like chemotaxis protein